MKSLPKGLSIGGDLYTGYMFKNMKPEEFINAFPDDIIVGGTIGGSFPWGDVEDESIDKFMRDLHNYRNNVQANKTLREAYKRWKKFI